MMTRPPVSATWGSGGVEVRVATRDNTIQYNSLHHTHRAMLTAARRPDIHRVPHNHSPRHTQSHTLGHWTPHSEHAQGSLRADHTTEERGREEDAHTQRACDAWQRRSCGIHVRHCHIGRCMHHTAGSLKPAAIRQQGMGRPRLLPPAALPASPELTGTAQCTHTDATRMLGTRSAHLAYTHPPEESAERNATAYEHTHA